MNDRGTKVKQVQTSKMFFKIVSLYIVILLALTHSMVGTKKAARYVSFRISFGYRKFVSQCIGHEIFNTCNLPPIILKQDQRPALVTERSPAGR